jgi:hypothetical protein
MAPNADGGARNGGGVLGNLPRSRPGARSEKRGAGEGSPAAPAARRPARRMSSPSGRGAASARGGQAPPRRRQGATHTPPPPESSGSMLGDAARVAGRAARLGVDLAGGILKRLPRP